MLFIAFEYRPVQCSVFQCITVQCRKCICVLVQCSGPSPWPCSTVLVPATFSGGRFRDSAPAGLHNTEKYHGTQKLPQNTEYSAEHRKLQKTNRQNCHTKKTGKCYRTQKSATEHRKLHPETENYQRTQKNATDHLIPTEITKHGTQT